MFWRRTIITIKKTPAILSKYKKHKIKQNTKEIIKTSLVIILLITIIIISSNLSKAESNQTIINTTINNTINDTTNNTYTTFSNTNNKNIIMPTTLIIFAILIISIMILIYYKNYTISGLAKQSQKLHTKANILGKAGSYKLAIKTRKKANKLKYRAEEIKIR